MDRPFVTRHGIAQRIGISPRRVQQMIDARVIPDAPRISVSRTLLFHWPSVKIALDRAGIPTLENPPGVMELGR